jgi:putative transposase
MQHYHVPLLPDKIYHVFSRAIGNEKLFREDKNYQYFLRQYAKHVLPIAETFAWCLLPNHFHFLLRVKPYEDVAEYFALIKSKQCNYDVTSDFLMERFSNWLNSYTKAFNKMYARKGGLFIDNVRRVEVNSEEQFGATVFYIHKNPVHHGLCSLLNEWKWSSYSSYISKEPIEEASKEVVKWFGNREGFLQYHTQPVYLKNAVIIE